jgi:hypothetical protein
MKRQFGQPVAGTPSAKKKQRIGGAWLIGGVSVNLIAMLLPMTAAYRTATLALLCTGGLCLLVAVAYMFRARRAS